jgi:filamentous hemagglutinin family protein
MSDKNPSRKAEFRLSTPVRLGVAAVAACFIAGPVLSNPVNPTVVNGTATFNQAGNVLTVTNSNGAIINWQQFNIGAGETTHFAQASASSSVLNRVLANDPSLIYGTLSSNGRVWLVNPAGILVGAGGRVDVAGFVASTLNISNADFLAGRNLFVNDGTAQNVINQGEIRTPSGGSVYLVGSNVTNEGLIHTPAGETILAAGQTVSLIDSATPGVKVDITGAAGNATNLGTITADAGRIGIAGVIVRNSGLLNASSVVSEGGRIFLKATGDTLVEGGRLDATSVGGKGGQVDVLGDRVAVMNDAEIDVSGTAGGGYIRVGGDYQGKNSEIQNASITYLGKDAVLRADATEVGAGGTVIVWADDTARAYGSIFARGGATGGNGGFVETSGKRYLDATRAADVSAAFGLAGTWLLDPSGLTIINTGSDLNIPGPSPFQAGVGISTLTATTINTGLTTGNVAIISDVGDDIKFDASVSGAIVITNGTGSARVLSLSAGNDIKFTGGSTTFQTTVASSPLTVNFNPATSRKVEVQSGSTLTFSGSAASSAVSGVIVGGPGAKTWENQGILNMSGESYIDLHDGTYYSAFNNTAGGVVNITSSAGWSFLSENGTQDGALNNAGTINVNGTNGGSTNYTAWEVKYNQAPGGVLNIGAGKVLSMQNADVIRGAVNIGAGGKLALSQDFTGAHSFINTTINGPGWVDIAGGGAPSFSGVTVNNASLVNSAGDLTIPTGIIGTTGDIGLLASGILWGGAGIASLGKLMLVGGWDNTSSVTAPTVTSGVGSIQIIDAQIQSAGDMTLKSGGDILIKRNLSGSTRVESSAVMAVETWGDLTLVNYFDPGGSVELKSAGNQSIQLKGALSDLVVQASAGGAGGGYTRISSGGTQTINFTAAGTHTLVLTGGMAGTTSASGAGASIESAGAQTILNGGTLAINLTGGNSALTNQSSYEDYGLPSQRLICASCATHNSAQIRSKSSQTIAASTITIIGGSGGNGNYAGIDADGTSTIVATGAVSISGGSSGGIYVGGIHDDYVQNDAGISANGALNLTAASILLDGGGANFGGAYIGGGSSITVNTSGNLTLNGGTSPEPVGAALLYSDASPATLKWYAPAVIGSDAGSLTSITLNVGGDLTLNGGTAGQDGGSMALIGGVRNTPINLVINSQGAIAMNSATALSDRIGSKAGGTFSLHSGLGGAGAMTLGKGLIGTGIGTGGSVLLDARGAGGISQIAGGMIATDWLDADADLSAGTIGLLSFENRVGNLDATSVNQTITFNGRSVGLGTINSGTGSSTISAFYDIHDNNGFGVTNITAGSVSLYSTNGGAAGSLAISADTATTGNITSSVSGSAPNGGISIRNNAAATPGNIGIVDGAMAGNSVRFSHGGSDLVLTASHSFEVDNGGDLAILAGSNMTLNAGGPFINVPGAASSVLLGAVGAMDFAGAFSLPNNNLGLAAATIQVDSAVDAKNIAVVAGALNISNSGGLHADNHLLAVVAGDVDITGGYIKTTSGDLEMLVGGDLNISDGGHIWAGYTQMSPPYADASIAVGGDIRLNDGSYINAANDVFLDMLGPTSTLYLNDAPGNPNPSYILSSIGGLPPTTHLAFLARNSGGIVIDGEDTTDTVVGGSGFFAVDTSTPALPGAGLEITYAQNNTGVLALLANLLGRAVDDVDPTTTPTDDNGPRKFDSAKGDKGDKDGGFGEDEDDKDKKKSDDGKDGKKDEKPSKKQVAQCS